VLKITTDPLPLARTPGQPHDVTGDGALAGGKIEYLPEDAGALNLRKAAVLSPTSRPGLQATTWPAARVDGSMVEILQAQTVADGVGAARLSAAAVAAAAVVDLLGVVVQVGWGRCRRSATRFRPRCKPQPEHHVVRLQRVAIAAVIDNDTDRVLMLWRHRFVTDEWWVRQRSRARHWICHNSAPVVLSIFCSRVSRSIFGSPGL
jgi:hypothetical protein